MTAAERSALTQQDDRVRFDWGPEAAEIAARTADVVVVIDVLSFTTTVCIATQRGITVLPYPWPVDGAADLGAADHARLRSARLAKGRSAGLSPTSLATAPAPDRVVVPSPNGSAIAYRLAQSGSRVLAGCLRNRSAVAAALSAQLATGTGVVVIAAGERWSDGSLRPCAEDLWGAGAILDRLPRPLLSTEARLAADAWSAIAGTEVAALASCAGGRELAVKGYAADVEVAAQVDVCAVVPELVDGEFHPSAEVGGSG